MPSARTSPPHTASARKKRDCGPTPGIRRSKASRWRAAVLIAVHVLIALHVAHWASTGRSISPLEPSEAMEFTKDGLVNAGLVFFGLAILSTAILGRWFCGWACHLVALQDLCTWLLGKVGIKPRPLRSRVLLVVPFLAFGYMFLYPIWYRLRHDMGVGLRGVELETQDFWATFPPWPIAVATLAVAGFAIVYFLGSKGFCTYACPYGAIFTLTDRLAPWRIRVTDACEGCGHCTATCTSNVQVHAEVRDYGAVIDPGCMKCLDCVSVCPKDALYFGAGRPEVLTRRRLPERDGVPARNASRWKVLRWHQLNLWEELLLAVSFTAAFLAFRGLYGLIPFLFSLAIAGIVAFLTLQTARVLVRRNVSVQRLVVKADGRVTRPGAAFLVGMTVLGLFWLHSGAVQAAGRRLERGWSETEAARRSWFRQPGAALAPAQRELAASGIAAGRFLERYSLRADPRTSVRVAGLSLLVGDEDEFVRRMRAAIEEDPGDASLQIGLAEYEAARGRAEPTLAALERALELAPDNAAYVQRTVEIAAAVAPLERVQALLQAGLELHPEHPVLLLHVGVLLVESRRLDAAAAVLARAVAADPDAPHPRDVYGLTLKMLGRHAEAIEQYRALRALLPDEQDPVFQIADSAARLRDYALARETLRELVAPPETQAQAWALVGGVARENGDREEATSFLERAAELDPHLTRPQ